METLKVFRVKKDFEGGSLTEGEQQEQKFKVKASELVISKSNVVEQKGSEAFVYCTRASPPHASGYIPSSFLEHLSAEEANAFLRKSNLPLLSEAKVLNMRKLVPYSDKEATKRLLMHSGKQREDAPGLVPWKNGYSSYKKAHYNEALSQFKDKQIVFSSKISFNIAMAYKQMNQYESAVFYFTQAISQDPFFALALFLRGVCYWIGMKDPLQAIIDYSAADNLCKEGYIDYTPIGLNFVLSKAEILYNMAVCLTALKEYQRAEQQLLIALRFKWDKSHGIIEKLLKHVQQKRMESQGQQVAFSSVDLKTLATATPSPAAKFNTLPAKLHPRPPPRPRQLNSNSNPSSSNSNSSNALHSNSSSGNSMRNP